MAELWSAGRPLTVREVRTALHTERELAHTTVMTVLDNLFRKGMLHRQTDERAYKYEPTVTREGYTAWLMHQVWAFSANPAAALVFFIESMSPEQRTALRDALRVIGPDPPGTSDPDS